MTDSERLPVDPLREAPLAAAPRPEGLDEPTTNAGRAAYHLIREPLIYGVRDRLDGNHAIVWAVRDGLIAAEAEAAARERARLSDTGDTEPAP